MRLALLALLALSCFAQDPAPVTPWFVLDTRSGQAIPCVNCQIHTYAAGTSTPAATYTDYTLGTANGNPVCTNTQGYVVSGTFSGGVCTGSTITGIWIGTQCLKFTLQDSASVTIWTQDHLCDAAQIFKALLATSAGAGLIGYEYPGGVLQTVQTKLQQTVNVLDFGAACNNSGNDTAAFNSAVFALSSGGTVLVPAGTCDLGAPGFALTANVGVQGTGSATILKATSALYPSVLIANVSNAVVKELSITAAGDGIDITGSSTSVQNAAVLNVSIISVGASNSCIHQTNSGGNAVYWTLLENIFCNGGTAAPNVSARNGFLFDGNAGDNIGPVIIGGRVTNSCQGIKMGATSAYVYATALDGITNDMSGMGAGTCIAEWIPTGAGYNQANLRMEGGGTGGSIDIDVQMDSGSSDDAFCLPGFAGASGKFVDNGINDSLSCADGSGGVTNYTNLAQVFGTSGVTATALLGGYSTKAIFKAPASTGVPQVNISDSSGHVGWWVTADYDGSANGMSCTWQLATGGSAGVPTLSCGTEGGSASPTYIGSNMAWQWPLHTPASSSEACVAGTQGWDTSYYYVCTATNTWKRAALSGF